MMACQAAMDGEKLRKGLWLEEEDELLTTFVNLKGNRRWDALAKESGEHITYDFYLWSLKMTHFICSERINSDAVYIVQV